jgi:hypothetical protein
MAYASQLPVSRLPQNETPHHWRIQNKAAAMLI